MAISTGNDSLVGPCPLQGPVPSLEGNSVASDSQLMALQITPDIEALLRMGLAVLCGMAVGLNRAHHGSTPHPNRLRVHVLVGLSAALMVMANGTDPAARSRAIQGVATGVGFLGAGEILTPAPSRQSGKPEVRGLSSAASIWFTAALGVTVAASSPLLALLALVLALITLSDRSNGDATRGALPDAAIEPQLPEEDSESHRSGPRHHGQTSKR